MPKISVIIPVYNVEKYLRECLDSVVNQTLTDIEIISINDGSTDDSFKILEEYAQKDKRITVINQENQGQGVARNNGIEIAKGEYIAFVDPDDFIDLDTFEIVYNKFKEAGGEIVQIDFATCDEKGVFTGNQALYKRAQKYLNYKLENNCIFRWSDFNSPNLTALRLCVWDKIYSTKLIKENNIRFAETRIGEDNIFSISVNLLADKILYMNKYLYHYRTRKDSSVNKASDDNFCVFDNVILLKEFLNKNDLFAKYEQAYADYVIEAFALHYTNIPEESVERYLNRCAELLSEADYKRFLKETEPKFTFWQRVFSIKNKKVNGKKQKMLCILGCQFLLKSKKQKGV